MKQGKKTTDKDALARRIKACETARMWMIVLAAILMLGGYTTDFLPVLYACVLPLFAALCLTLAIKHLERGASDD